MRFLRALGIAIITAAAGMFLAVLVGDYLTRLAHIPEMEGQRGMTIIFLCAPLGILAGLIIGVVASILVRRQGVAGFFVAQGWALLVACLVAGLVFGIPYLLSDKPPRIDGKRVELQFELRVPGKEDEAWSDWIVATQRADLNPVPETERFSVRYRVQPVALDVER